MANVTVRNLPDEVHRALRVRAATHGRSTEAEIRDILEDIVKPVQRIRMGDALAEIGRRVGFTDEEMILFQRDKTPVEPMRFDQ